MNTTWHGLARLAPAITNKSVAASFARGRTAPRPAAARRGNEEPTLAIQKRVSEEPKDPVPYSQNTRNGDRAASRTCWTRTSWRWPCSPPKRVRNEAASRHMPHARPSHLLSGPPRQPKQLSRITGAKERRAIESGVERGATSHNSWPFGGVGAHRPPPGPPGLFDAGLQLIRWVLNTPDPQGPQSEVAASSCSRFHEAECEPAFVGPREVQTAQRAAGRRNSNRRPARADCSQAEVKTR